MPPIWYDAGSFKLYFYRREEHRLPHVAVLTGRRRRATIAIETGAVLAGKLSAQELRAVKDVLATHTDEALAAFEAARTHQPVIRLSDARTTDGGEK